MHRNAAASLLKSNGSSSSGGNLNLNLNLPFLCPILVNSSSATHATRKRFGSSSSVQSSRESAFASPLYPPGDPSSSSSSSSSLLSSSTLQRFRLETPIPQFETVKGKQKADVDVFESVEQEQDGQKPQTSHQTLIDLQPSYPQDSLSSRGPYSNDLETSIQYHRKRYRKLLSEAQINLLAIIDHHQRRNQQQQRQRQQQRRRNVDPRDPDPSSLPRFILQALETGVISTPTSETSPSVDLEIESSFESWTKLLKRSYHYRDRKALKMLAEDAIAWLGSQKTETNGLQSHRTTIVRQRREERDDDGDKDRVRDLRELIRNLSISLDAKEGLSDRVREETLRIEFETELNQSLWRFAAGQSERNEDPKRDAQSQPTRAQSLFTTDESFRWNHVLETRNRNWSQTFNLGQRVRQEQLSSTSHQDITSGDTGRDERMAREHRIRLRSLPAPSKYPRLNHSRGRLNASLETFRSRNNSNVVDLSKLGLADSKRGKSKLKMKQSELESEAKQAALWQQKLDDPHRERREREIRDIQASKKSFAKVLRPRLVEIDSSGLGEHLDQVENSEVRFGHREHQASDSNLLPTWLLLRTLKHLIRSGEVEKSQLIVKTYLDSLDSLVQYQGRSRHAPTDLDPGFSASSTLDIDADADLDVTSFDTHLPNTRRNYPVTKPLVPPSGDILLNSILRTVIWNDLASSVSGFTSESLVKKTGVSKRENARTSGTSISNLDVGDEDDWREVHSGACSEQIRDQDHGDSQDQDQALVQDQSQSQKHERQTGRSFEKCLDVMERFCGSRGEKLKSEIKTMMNKDRRSSSERRDEALQDADARMRAEAQILPGSSTPKSDRPITDSTPDSDLEIEDPGSPRLKLKPSETTLLILLSSLSKRLHRIQLGIGLVRSVNETWPDRRFSEINEKRSKSKLSSNSGSSSGPGSHVDASAFLDEPRPLSKVSDSGSAASTSPETPSRHSSQTCQDPSTESILAVSNSSPVLGNGKAFRVLLAWCLRHATGSKQTDRLIREVLDLWKGWRRSKQLQDSSNGSNTDDTLASTLTPASPTSDQHLNQAESYSSKYAWRDRFNLLSALRKDDFKYELKGLGHKERDQERRKWVTIEQKLIKREIENYKLQKRKEGIERNQVRSRKWNEEKEQRLGKSESAIGSGNGSGNGTGNGDEIEDTKVTEGRVEGAERVKVWEHCEL